MRLDFKDDLILRLCKDKNVLHIGAADYPFHLEKAKNNELLHQKLARTAKHVLGLDNNDESINELKRFGITNIKKADIMHPLNFKPGEFDVIILGDVIEHLENPGIALSNVRKIMNKGTDLVVTTPNCYCYFNIANIFRKKENVHADHFFWTSRQTMKQLFGHLGFRIISFRYVNFGAYRDIKTIRGRLFYHLFLKHIKKIRATLFFVLRI